MEKIRNANGTIPTHKLRMSMKVTMQTKCGVFRENQLLTEGSSLFNHLFISQVKEIHYYRYMYFPIKKQFYGILISMFYQVLKRFKGGLNSLHTSARPTAVRIGTAM